jgi:beta-galactosidase
METAGQACGYILYRTQVAGPIFGELSIEGMHDYAKVFLNGSEQGTIDSRLGQSTVALHSGEPENVLDILVENGGRINFSKRLRDERKGIVGSVTFGGKILHGWQIYPLPMKDVRSIVFKPNGSGNLGPSFLRGTFALSQTGDTYLDMRGQGKGIAWINGHLLGRFWNIGPQYTLYVPEAWLKTGANEVVIFDFDAKANHDLRGLDHPVFNDRQ